MLKDSIPENSPCLLVEGPSWGDVAFYGKWLLAAAKADALWKRAIKDRGFENEVCAVKGTHFGIGATVLLWRLETTPAFVVRLDEGYWVEVFTLMVEMGFFVRTGQRYQMAIPTRLTLGKVKRAALKLAQTEDDDEKFYLHPEYLIATMPYAEATAWQERLRRMEEDHRCADRRLLLETPSDFKIPRPAALRLNPQN